MFSTYRKQQNRIRMSSFLIEKLKIRQLSTNMTYSIFSVLGSMPSGRGVYYSFLEHGGIPDREKTENMAAERKEIPAWSGVWQREMGIWMTMPLR